MPPKKAASPKGKSKRSPKKSSEKKAKKSKLPSDAPSFETDKIAYLLSKLDIEVEDEEDSDAVMAQLFSYMEDRDSAVASILSLPSKVHRKLNDDISQAAKAEEDELANFTVSRVDTTLEGYEPEAPTENASESGSGSSEGVTHYYESVDDPVERTVEVIEAVAGYAFYVFSDDEDGEEIESQIKKKGFENSVVLNPSKIARADDDDSFFIIYVGVPTSDAYGETVNRLGNSSSIIYTVWKKQKEEKKDKSVGKTKRKTSMDRYQAISKEQEFEPTEFTEDILSSLGGESEQGSEPGSEPGSEAGKEEEEDITHFSLRVGEDERADALGSLVGSNADLTLFMFGVPKDVRKTIQSLREGEDEQTLFFLKQGEPGENKYAYGYVINYSVPKERDIYNDNVEIVAQGRVITFVSSKKDAKKLSEILAEDPPIDYTELDDVENVPEPNMPEEGSEPEPAPEPANPPQKSPPKPSPPKSPPKKPAAKNTLPPPVKPSAKPSAKPAANLPTPSKLPPPPTTGKHVPHNITPSKLPPPPDSKPAGKLPPTLLTSAENEGPEGYTEEQMMALLGMKKKDKKTTRDVLVGELAKLYGENNGFMSDWDKKDLQNLNSDVENYKKMKSKELVALTQARIEATVRGAKPSSHKPSATPATVPTGKKTGKSGEQQLVPALQEVELDKIMDVLTNIGQPFDQNELVAMLNADADKIVASAAQPAAAETSAAAAAAASAEPATTTSSSTAAAAATAEDVAEVDDEEEGGSGSSSESSSSE